MKNIQSIELNDSSKEELLPGFSADFPYIATCAELDRYLEPLVPWHWHPAVELFYMKSGSLEYTTPHGKWIFPAGSGGFVNANVLHMTRWDRSAESNVQLLHLFDSSLISGGHGNRMEKKYVLPLTSNSDIEILALTSENPAHAPILRQIRDAFDLSEVDPYYEFKLREMLTGIWMELFAFARPTMEVERQNERSNEPVKQMMVYIHEHYGQRICVDDLAAIAHISKRACFRLFQDNLHMTPVEYMQSYRLRMACQMLAKGSASVTEISGRCGLGSTSYFGKVFREKFGCTPLEFRKRWHDSDTNRQ